MERKTLCLATRNAHKVHEIAAILAPYWDVKCSADFPEVVEEIEETGDTFLANATLKAVATSHAISAYALADDSGLEVDALDGAPGVFSARYGGIPSSAEKNNARLLEELARLGALAPGQRRARFRCVLVLAKAGEVLASFDGACEGTLLLAPQGANGFGYDPLFVPAGFKKTFGQLSEKTKNTLSHRGHALRKFLAWLKLNPPQ